MLTAFCFISKNKIDINLKNYPKKLLFLRKSSNIARNSKRLLENRQQIVDLCKKYNYIDIDQTNYTMEEVIYLMNNATHLITEVGGSLSHLLWTNKPIKHISINWSYEPWQLLPNFYENSNKKNQINSFLKHIEVARITNLPLIIHARDADDDIIQILTEEYNKSPFTGVIHCFTASYELAKAALSIGFYISFSGIITFKNADEIRISCKKIPIDRILVETDAPFLAPVPFRGNRNEPSYITETIKKVAEIKNLSEEEVINITTNNFFKLFKRAIL